MVGWRGVAWCGWVGGWAWCGITCKRELVSGVHCWTWWSKWVWMGGWVSFLLCRHRLGAALLPCTSPVCPSLCMALAPHNP